MVGDRNIDLEKINRYLSDLKGIRFVISSEGFPLYWSNNISESEAERLIAGAVDLYNGLKNSFIAEEKEFFTAALNIGEKTTGLFYMGNNIIIVISDKNELISTILQNLARYARKEPIKCSWCGEDLTLKVFKCPRCGSNLPYGIEKCPFCGLEKISVECPKCGRRISPRGRKMVFKRSRTDTIVGGIFTGISTGFFIAGIIEAFKGSIVSVPMFAAAAIIGWTGINALKTRRLVEE